MPKISRLLPTQKQPNYYSVAEAAFTSGLSTGLIRQMIGRREIPFTRVRRRILIPCADFEAFLKKQTIPAKRQGHQ
jgi:excisionase family DNA binding protein